MKIYVLFWTVSVRQKQRDMLFHGAKGSTASLPVGSWRGGGWHAVIRGESSRRGLGSVGITIILSLGRGEVWRVDLDWSEIVLGVAGLVDIWDGARIGGNM